MEMRGIESVKEREEEERKIIKWGMKGFDDMRIFEEKDKVGDEKVFGGK